MGLCECSVDRTSAMFPRVCVVLLFLVPAVAAENSRCKAFCDRALKLCTGGDASYDSPDECMDSCAKFSTSKSSGFREFVNDDSLSCREFWLDRIDKMLKEQKMVHPGTCDYAAVGGGMCDNSVPHNCDAYCGQMSEEGDCGPGKWVYPDPEACQKRCQAFKQAPTDSMRGDSLQCRLLYINIGEQSTYPKAKPEFCPNAGAESAMCKDGAQHDTCEDYCAWNTKFCGSNETSTDCLQYCRALNPTQRACHLKYVAVAARCTVPAVPCYHRTVCMDPTGKTGFEEAPNGPAPAMGQRGEDDGADEAGEDDEL